MERERERGGGGGRERERERMASFLDQGLFVYTLP